MMFQHCSQRSRKTEDQVVRVHGGRGGWDKVRGEDTHTVLRGVHAPVAEPGLTKNLPSYSAAWKLVQVTSLVQCSEPTRRRDMTAYVCVCPLTRTSTSIWRAMAERESRSPVGIHLGVIQYGVRVVGRASILGVHVPRRS
jgi:hypothetical protein